MKKSKIIAICGIVGTLIIITILVLLTIRPYLRVSQVLSAPSLYYNKEIQIYGVVSDFSGGDFNLTEGSLWIPVDTSGVSIPGGIKNGDDLVVAGIFNSSHVIKANLILVQCS